MDIVRYSSFLDDEIRECPGTYTNQWWIVVSSGSLPSQRHQYNRLTEDVHNLGDIRMCHCEADLFLAPQIYASFNGFKLDMNQFPILWRLYEAYLGLPAFQDAMPEKQPDAPAEATT